VPVSLRESERRRWTQVVVNIGNIRDTEDAASRRSQPGRHHRYVPVAKRVYGYFAMPVPAGGRIVARVDPVRRDGVLVGRTVTLGRRGAVGSVARAMVEAARWVGCAEVSVERVVPPEAAAPLRAALTEATRAR
jgi:uncharacterized protein YcaQ